MKLHFEDDLDYQQAAIDSVVSLFKSQEVITILIIMVVMVTIIDRLSAYVRKKVLKVESLGYKS